MSASDVFSPGEQFSLFSLWAKASRWVTHPLTYLLGNGGRLNHKLKNSDIVNHIRCYNYIRRGPGVHCASCLKTVTSHSDLSYKLELIIMQICAHIPRKAQG